MGRERRRTECFVLGTSKPSRRCRDIAAQRQLAHPSAATAITGKTSRDDLMCGVLSECHYWQRRWPPEAVRTRYIANLEISPYSRFPGGAASHARVTATTIIGEMSRGEMIRGALPEHRFWWRDGRRKRYLSDRIAASLLQYYEAAPPCTPTPPQRRSSARPLDAI